MPFKSFIDGIKTKENINDIEGAKKDIERAISFHERSKSLMKDLANDIESHIKVDSLKDINTCINQYKKYMKKCIEELKQIDKDLDARINTIEENYNREVRERAEKDRIEFEQKKYNRYLKKE